MNEAMDEARYYHLFHAPVKRERPESPLLAYAGLGHWSVYAHLPIFEKHAVEITREEFEDRCDSIDRFLTEISGNKAANEKLRRAVERYKQALASGELTSSPDQPQP
jgi:hypothetical protein